MIYWHGMHSVSSSPSPKVLSGCIPPPSGVPTICTSAASRRPPAPPGPRPRRQLLALGRVGLGDVLLGLPAAGPRQIVRDRALPPHEVLVAVAALAVVQDPLKVSLPPGAKRGQVGCTCERPRRNQVCGGRERTIGEESWPCAGVRGRGYVRNLGPVIGKGHTGVGSAANAPQGEGRGMGVKAGTVTSLTSFAVTGPILAGCRLEPSSHARVR